MISIRIKGIAEVNRELARISSDVQGKVVAAALNRVADKGRTEMKRRITDEFALPAAEVNSRLRVMKASAKLGKLVAVIDPWASSRKGRSINLIRFVEKKVSMAQARKRAKQGTLDQLRFKIKKSGGLKMKQGAFIGNKGRTVFIREGNGRLPIKALQVIDVPQMFNTKRIMANVLRKIDSDLPIEMRRAVDAALAGRLGHR